MLFNITDVFNPPTGKQQNKHVIPSRISSSKPLAIPRGPAFWAA
jgi:hypothetical protein